MSISIAYKGLYRIEEFGNQYGGYDMDRIKDDLFAKVSISVQNKSGVYIFIKQNRGFKARYVGAATTNNLLSEGTSKRDIISNKLLPCHGSSWLLLLTCRKPQGMPNSTFKQRILELEEYLIVDFTLKGHDLFNKQKKPRYPKFDFGLERKYEAALHFKALINRKGVVHL